MAGVWLMTIETNIAISKLVDELIKLREEAGIDQTEMAKRMHCTQSRISKLESANLAWRIRDLMQYASALDYRVLFTIEKT